MSQQQQLGCFKRQKATTTGSSIGPVLRPHVLASPNPSYVPHEIVVNILHRLPVKPLFRFKCVSKSWHDLISTPDFACLHLERVNTKPENNNSGDLMFGTLAMDDDTTQSFFYSMPLHELGSVTPPSYKKLLLPGVSEWSLFGICNGLVFLKSHDDILLVCNPLTGDHVTIGKAPQVSFSLFLDNDNLFRLLSSNEFGRLFDMDDNYVLVSSYGFGYNSSCHDYEVVRLIEDNRTYDAMSVCEVQIYRLKGRTWRSGITVELPDESPYGQFHARYSKFILGDALYWWSSCDFFSKRRKHKVLRYQLEEERWSAIPLPTNQYRPWDEATIDLDGFGNYLCLSVKVLARHQWIDIWILPRDAVSLASEQPAWSKIFVTSNETLFGRSCYIHYQLAASLDDGKKFLFRSTPGCDGMVYWFDTRQKGVNGVDHCDDSRRNYFDQNVYVGTLISPFSNGTMNM